MYIYIYIYIHVFFNIYLNLLNIYIHTYIYVSSDSQNFRYIKNHHCNHKKRQCASKSRQFFYSREIRGKQGVCLKWTREVNPMPVFECGENFKAQGSKTEPYSISAPLQQSPILANGHTKILQHTCNTLQQSPHTAIHCNRTLALQRNSHKIGPLFQGQTYLTRAF